MLFNLIDPYLFEVRKKNRYEWEMGADKVLTCSISREKKILESLDWLKKKEATHRNYTFSFILMLFYIAVCYHSIIY